MTPTQYIAAAPEEKRADLKTLDALIKRSAPSFEPYVVGTTMLGYGKYHYRYESGTEGDSCRVGLASNKGGFSLYISAANEKGEWLAEQHRADLGDKTNVGKSCIRFKKLADLNLTTLEKVLKKAAQMPGPGEQPAATPKKSATAKKSTAKTPKKKAKAAAKPRARK